MEKNREEMLLGLLKEETYIPLKENELASFLMVPKEEIGEFRKLLNKLEEEYRILKTKKNKYMISNNTYYKGIFQANERGFGFVKVETEDKDIFIPEKHTKNAMSGDAVLIDIVKAETTEKRKEGKVVKILEHNKSKVVGVFQSSKNFGFVIPDDKRLGTDIFISKTKVNNAKNGEKVVVNITKYPENNKNAEGEIIEILGNVNVAGVDMLSLIREYELPGDFSEKVVEEVRNVPNKVLDEEIVGRKDFRKDITFTIDGADAKDLDDAISIEKTNSNTYLLNVHIADVSHYVKENSEIDKEARYRGTSIYMLDRVIPMLPEELSNGICSLNVGEDRLTLSVCMEIDLNGKILSSDVYKGVINVSKRMTYSDVYNVILNEDEKLLKEYENYIEKINIMKEITEKLEKNRSLDGELNLDIAEGKIVLDENGRTIDILREETTIANRIIEQFMVTANEVIAEKFFWLEAPFIYRVHEVPDVEKIKELNKFLVNFGAGVKFTGDQIYPKAFAEVLDSFKGKPEEKIISNLILRTLKVAKYESINKGHFGIASKYYTHYTAPIRRYPDLFIHRIISKYIASNYNMDEKTKAKYLELAGETSMTSSDRERLAQKVERDAVDIKKAEYMENKIGNVYDGVISNITNFGMFVELENTVEGIVRFDDLGNEYYNYDENTKRLIGKKSNEILKIGDKIKIEVIKASKILREIDFKRVKE